MVIPEQISVPNAADAFDDMDNLKDERVAAALKSLARRLVDVTRALARES